MTMHHNKLLEVTETKTNAQKMRADFDSDYSWHEFLAENGHCSFQYFFAADINADSSHPNRLVNVYKWLLLSALYGELRSNEILPFVMIKMSEEELRVANKLVDDWQKAKSQEINDGDISGWSQELRKAFKLS